MLLVSLPPLEAMVGRGRDQERGGGRGAEEGEEVDILLELGHLREALCEGHAEQEREQHLDAGERDAELVQELDQLSIEPFVLALRTHCVISSPKLPLTTQTERNRAMRIESSVTAISWIPSEAVEGLPKLPFTMGMAHYDDPPPGRDRGSGRDARSRPLP